MPNYRSFLTLLFAIALSVIMLCMAGRAVASISCYQCHGWAAPPDYRPIDAPYRNITSGGFVGNHRTHMSAAAIPNSCTPCHPSSGSYNSSHRDGLITLSANINNSPLQTEYKNSTSAFPQTRFPVPGSCNSVNCHFEALTPTWGVDPASTGCSSCHGAPPGDGNHARHDSYYGSGSCSRCHIDHAAEPKPFAHATSAGKRPLIFNVSDSPGLSYSKAANFNYPNYLPSQTSAASRNGTCSDISCHANTSATWGGKGCLGCHSVTQGNRAAITGQFSANSHHIQGEVTDARCYQCHWEAKSDGTIDPAYHGGSANPGSPVDLVVYGAATRPSNFTADVTAVQYTADGSREEIEKVTSHCLGCHSDQNNVTQPFGDGKTPKQYAWDGTSVAARYAQSGRTTWGKYSTVTNAAQKRISKALSAHGNAATNQRGWSTSSGVDGVIQNTSGNTAVQCYDCHNSHGSFVAGITSRYSSATGNRRGALLKETVSGLGGYATTYKPLAGGTVADKNLRNPGASICLDCHLNQSATSTPWGYGSTYGATQAILGYFDAPIYNNYSTPGAEQRYPFKKASAMKGGHFGASTPLTTNAMSNIGGLCTSCHDPHGVSPTLGANQLYAVPLLKGTWLTSPYKEDTAPANNTNFTIRKDIGREGVPYNIDQNTFGEGIINPVAGISETVGNSAAESKSAGLCLGCHPKESLTNGTTHTWKSKDRIHESVKGWKTANGTVKHNYSCSKCHTPHDSSSLPRLMVTNCLDSKHKGRTGNNSTPLLSDNGWKTYGGVCSGAAAEFGTSWCLSRAGSLAFGGSGSGRFPGSWGGDKPGFQGYGVSCHEGNSIDQLWNDITPWSVNPTAPPVPPVPGQPVPLSSTSVRWNYTDTANDNDGYHLHDSGNTLKASNTNAKSTYVVESGLTANTRYTRHLHAYNALGDGLPSGDVSVYTWPQFPNVTSDTYLHSTPDFTFTNAAGFGPGSLDYYRYVWTQNPSYTFTDNETIWESGTLTTTATADGIWYLYLKSYNGDNVSGNYSLWSKFNKYDSTAPTVSAPIPADGGSGAITNPLVFTISDEVAGINWATITVQISGNMGYAKSYTAADTTIVTKTGSDASYVVTVKPDAPYGNNEVITWSFRVKDMVGHELVSPSWSFTASNTVVAPPTMVSASSTYYSWMRWSFVDNSDNETGFRLHDQDHVVKGTTTSTYFDETGLTANTQYTRHVHAYNANGESGPSLSLSRYTLALPPDVTSDKAISTWGNAPITFTNSLGFGTGKVEYYLYLWGQEPFPSYWDNRPAWGSGQLTITPVSEGNWYLHVWSYNKDDVPSQYSWQRLYGPYRYDITPPAGLAFASPANGAADLPVTTLLNSTVATDSSSGSVQYLFQIARDIGFTTGLESSDWQTGTSYAPLLEAGTTYYWRVKARDKALNETPYTAPARSFTTLNVPVSRATWTTKGDFENNASTTGTPTTRSEVSVSGTNQTDDAGITLSQSANKWRNPTVAAGYNHALAVKPDGSLWSWGYNYYGQLGDGTSGNGTDKSTPVQVSGLGAGAGVIAVVASYESSLALKSDGSVVAWGRNNFGQLGDGSKVDKPTPVTVTGLGAGSGVIAIAAGRNHFLALKSDGTVWSWGENAYYQLGDGTGTQRSVPVQVSGLTGVVAIVAGGIHSFAVKADGSVWAWGYNSYGELGDGTNSSKSSPVQVSTMGPGSGVIALAGGYLHSLAVKADGSVWAWGYNYYGQLGDGTYGSGSDKNSPLQIIAPGSGASAVAAARHSSLLLKGDGSVLAWGENSLGQLGDTTTTQRTTPVPVSGLGANSGVIAVSAGEASFQSLKGAGTQSAWGYSLFGLIVGGVNGVNSTPITNSAISGIQLPLSYNSQYLTLGTVTSLKVNAGSNVTWRGIYWDGSVTPPDTTIKCRTRGADTEAGLESAAWSDYYLTSRASITTAASQWLEVELTLQTSNNYSSPLLNDLAVTYTAN